MQAADFRRACAGKYGKSMEDEVEKVLWAHGYQAAEPRPGGHQPSGTYSRNPRGSQQSPDFYIAIGDETRKLELKSSRNSNRPTWNGGWPRRDTFYLFNLPKLWPNEAVAFIRGADLVTERQEAAFGRIASSLEREQYTARADQQLAEASETPADPPFTFHLRNMFNQRASFFRGFEEGTPMRAAAEERAAAAFFSPTAGPLESERGHDGQQATVERQEPEAAQRAGKDCDMAAHQYYAGATEETRKQLGQFFTPKALRDQLFELLARHPPEGEACGCPALEPSAGAGALTEVILKLGHHVPRRSGSILS